MRSVILKFLGLFWLFQVVCNGAVVKIENNSTLNSLNQSPDNHDVKFIVRSSLSTAKWNPGVSMMDNSNQKILDYDVEGLNLYSLQGKVNIFGSDVLTLEKYGSFAGSESQKQLIENLEKDKKNTLEGLNISVKVFLLLKYFYFYNYKFLDSLEYQYSTYKFYGEAVNTVDTIFWYGSSTNGIIEKDFYPLSKKSQINFYTDFNEQRLYVLQLADLIKMLPIDSIKLGIYRINWLKPAFLGSYNQNGVPVIHHAEMVSTGVTMEITHNFFNSFNTGLSIDYGFDNYINYTTNSVNADYISYDIYIDYLYQILTRKTYDVNVNLKVLTSQKRFYNSGYHLENEAVTAFSVGLSIVF